MRKLVAVAFSRVGAMQLRQLLEASLRNVPPDLVADDVHAFADLLRALDNGPQTAAHGRTPVDVDEHAIDDAPMTFTATARRLGCSPDTVSRMVARGELETVTVGKRRRVTAAAVAAKTRPGAASVTSGECPPASNPTGTTSTRAATAVKAGTAPGPTRIMRSAS